MEHDDIGKVLDAVETAVGGLGVSPDAVFAGLAVYLVTGVAAAAGKKVKVSGIANAVLDLVHDKVAGGGGD